VNRACAMIATLAVTFVVGCNSKRSSTTSPTTHGLVSDPLPCWNEGPSKKAIVSFVDHVTKRETADFVPEEDRIAVFDNDGTLWVEEPLPTEVMCMLDEVKRMAPQHPDWKKKHPYPAVLNNDMKGLMASGQNGFVTLFVATHVGMTTESLPTRHGGGLRPRSIRAFTCCTRGRFTSRCWSC
jgi:hypothetical protein